MSEEAPSEYLPPGITAEVLAKFRARQHGNAKAAMLPLPGPLRRAFAPVGSTAGGPLLRPVLMGDFVELARMDHPLYRVSDPDTCPAQWTRLQKRQACALFGLGWLASAKTIQSDFEDHFRAAVFECHVGYDEKHEPGDTITIESTIDGPGWWLNIYGMLRREYGCSRAEALREPVAEAWALRTLDQERNPYLERTGDCYVAQESTQ